MMNGSRWTIFTVLAVLSLVCVVSVLRLGAANPASGTIMPTSEPLTWNGTAAGGTSNGEATCVEGVELRHVHPYRTGTPADWAGKRIEVVLTWVVLATDYDLYIHKESNGGPAASTQSSSAGRTPRSETAHINPALHGTACSLFTSSILPPSRRSIPRHATVFRLRNAAAATAAALRSVEHRLSRHLL